MTQSMSVTQFRSEFDAFLYASIDEGGALLSVLSALARLDFDPWQEAEHLSRMSQEIATQRLSALISTLPGGPLRHQNCKAIATRLIALLPKRADITITRPETASNISTLNNSRVVLPLIIINMIFLALSLGSQYFPLHHQSSTKVGNVHAPTGVKTIANVPPSSFGK
jgi:hypothetical protein